MNNTFPEDMDRLSEEPVWALKVVEDYIRYMCERIDITLQDIKNQLILSKQISGTITDSTNGFIDTGISSEDHIVLVAHSLTASNDAVRISNLSNGGNYRVQIINCVTNEIVKSGTYNLYICYINRR